MANIVYIKSALNHSSALTPVAVAVTQFGLWGSIKKGFKKYAKPLAMVAGIALSIAVPFVAPTIATTLFSGTMVGTGIIGQAIAGAGMGAVAGALSAYGTGQNVLTGALTGGALGGLTAGGSAYFSGAGLTTTAPPAGTVAAGTAGAAGPTNLVSPSVSGVNVAQGAVLPGASTAATAGTTSALTRSLTDAALKVAPDAIGTLVSSLSDSQVAQATKEMEAELARLKESDINAYNQQKQLYDALYARYVQIDPTAQAQLAEANVQQKTAAQIANLNPIAGSSAYGYGTDFNTRRLAIAGGAAGTDAYTDAYYKGEGAKTQALAGLSGAIPQYRSNTLNALSNNVTNAQNAQARLGSDISSFLTPFATEFASYLSPAAKKEEEEEKVTIGSLIDSALTKAD